MNVGCVTLTWENQVLRVVMPISSVQSNIRIAINVFQRKDLFQHLHAYSIFIAEVIIFFAIPAVGRFVVVPGDWCRVCLFRAWLEEDKT